MPEKQSSLKETGTAFLTITSLVAISFLAFSRELKDQVRKEQRGICAGCGRKVKKLTIHHIIPQSMGGSDTRNYAVGLCRDCHNYYDDLALNKGIFFKKR